MSGYLSQKIDDLNSGHIDNSTPRRFRMGRCTSPSELTRNLGSAILGQGEAIDAVVRALTIAAAGIRDPHRPIASILFAGPTGVGKTELARRLAAEVCGDPDKLCRIDMNSLAQEHYSASISGAPPGYSGSKEQFTLFDRELVEGNISRPGIVLFDEVEKAHPTVLRALLQILDSGTLHLTSGTSNISFRNTIVLLTSNLGSTQNDSQNNSLFYRFKNYQKIEKWDSLSSRLHRRRENENPTLTAIKNFFDPEMYNRFDEVIVFQPLTREHSYAIVDIELNKLEKILASQNITWSFDDKIRDHLVKLGFDKNYGARNLKRAVRLNLHGPIAKTIVSTDGIHNMRHIETHIRNGSIVPELTERIY